MSVASEKRLYSREVAEWCEKELCAARETGSIDSRPFVQNAELIIEALREFGQQVPKAAPTGQPRWSVHGSRAL